MFLGLGIKGNVEDEPKVLSGADQEWPGHLAREYRVGWR